MKWIKAMRGPAFCLLWILCGCSAYSDTEETAAVHESTLSIWLQSGYNLNQGIWKGDGTGKLLKDLGINLSISVEDTSRDRKLMQYLASGTLPDIIVFQGGDEAKLLMDAGLLQPLDSYQELMPNIFQNEIYEQAIFASRSCLSNGTGRLLLLPVSAGELAGGEYEYIPRLRWQAYSNAGCPLVQTLEDYLDVVEEIKRKNPYSYTGKELYGFSLSGEGDVYSLHLAAELGYLYGIDMEIVSPLMETDLTAGTSASIFREDSFYKRALHFYYEANQRGLLDRDSQNQTQKSLQEKYAEGEVIFGVREELTAALGTGARDVYAPVIARDMTVCKTVSLEYGNNIYFAVNSGSRYTQSACEFLNWLYDTDNQREFYNGAYGTIWKYDENGVPYITQEGWENINSKESIGSENVMNAAGFLGSIVLGDGYSLSCRYWPSSGEYSLNALSQEIREYLGADSVDSYLESRGQTVCVDSAVYMQPPISEQLQENMIKIGEYACQMSWEMIYAENEQQFQRIWDNLCQRARADGMDEIESYYQQIAEEMLERKE